MQSRNGKFVAADCKFLELQELRKTSRNPEGDFRTLTYITPRTAHLRFLWALFDLRHGQIGKDAFMRICGAIADDVKG